MRQIVLDTETTGLSPEGGDRIIEIGCVELLNRKLTGNNWQSYLNPERDSHEDALKIHGISNESLRDKPLFSAVADDLLAYLADAEVIIHNASFDVGFLDRELQLCGRSAFREHGIPVIDTLAMAREIYPGKRNSLDALCDRLGVDNSNRIQHGALPDAELLAQVYICLTRGQEALLIEGDSEGERLDMADGLDLSRFDLTVLAANEAEIAAHEELLQQLDSASGGSTVWPRATASAGTAVA